MNQASKQVILSLAGLIFLTGSAVHAKSGLQTKFGLVTIENLQPGETYNTREVASLPLVIKNTGDEKTQVKIEILSPDPKSPSIVQNGYEPIPDLSWIKLSRDEFPIEVGANEGADVLVTVPNDDKYLGKKYQVDLLTRSVTNKFMAVALRSSLRFTVASRRLTKEELDQREKVKQFETVDFDLIPNRAILNDVALGREVDLELEHKTALKVSNPNDADFLYYLDIVSHGEVEMKMPPDTEELPKEMILLKEKDVKVGANSIKKVKLAVKIPNEEKYRGKKFSICIRGKVAGTPVELYQLSRYYLTTQK